MTKPSELVLSDSVVLVCTADIPLHIGIRQTSDDGSPIVVSQPDSVQVGSIIMILTSGLHSSLLCVFDG